MEFKKNERKRNRQKEGGEHVYVPTKTNEESQLGIWGYDKGRYKERKRERKREKERKREEKREIEGKESGSEKEIGGREKEHDREREEKER